ncbi:MAG: hypothetical protein J7M40_17005 [Planctomycetes bacterium]|nr:hypothetical protein [Planctomycetota bacterium]
MNPQIFKRPPRWWSPRLHRFWLWLWRPVRKRIQRKTQRLIDIEIRGIEHLRKALAGGKGILITPNHSGHADPLILYDAAEPIAVMRRKDRKAATHELTGKLEQAVQTLLDGIEPPAYRANAKTGKEQT